MADGPTDPEPDGGSPEEGRILSPEELDITESEHVEQIDEDRFVVSSSARAGGTAPAADDATETTEQTNSPSESSTRGDDQPPGTASSEPRPEPERESSQGAATGELTDERVHRWLRESFEGSRSQYGFDITATFDGSVSQRRMASNDVVTIFESLVLWYAQQVDTDTPVEEVLGILLMEANVPVRYPPESLQALVKSAGLGPEDTIGDLFAAIGDEGLKL